jgi:hypothetical protein
MTLNYALPTNLMTQPLNSFGALIVVASVLIAGMTIVVAVSQEQDKAER